MDLKGYEEAALAQLKVDGKAMLKNQLELVFAQGLDLALDQVKAAIPGQMDDAIIDMLKVSLSPILKAQLMGLIDKI